MTGQGADAKTEKGEKSTPKINSSSRWLPIKADAGGTQVSGECLCTHTHTHKHKHNHTPAEQLPSAGNMCSYASV